MAVTVKFIADVVNWLSGLDKSEAAVGDNEQALEDLMKQAIDLGTAAGKTTDQIASDFSKAFGVPLDRAKKAIDEVTDATGDLENGAAKAGDAVGSEISDGASTAGDKMSELGSIAKDVLAGDFSSAADTAAGALSLLGPAGTAAGAIAAAGIGLISTAFGQAEEDRKQLEARASDLANAYIAAGSTILDTMTLASRIADISTSTDPTEKQDLKDLTKALGDRSLALRVMAGDTDALARAQTIAHAAEGSNAEFDERTQAYGKRKSATDAQREANDQLIQSVKKYTDINDVAVQQFDDVSNSLKQMINDASSATKQVDDLGNELYTLPNGDTIVIEADTGQATTDITKFHSDAITATETRTATVKVAVDSSAWDKWTPFQKLGIVKAVPQSGSGVPWKTQDLG